MAFTLHDDFDDPQGRLLNYDTYYTSQRQALPSQRHVDIRSFVQNDVTQTYASADTYMQQTAPSGATTFVVVEGEKWTGSNVTVGPQSDRKYFNGLSMACTTGSNVTSSITSGVDISAFGPNATTNVEFGSQASDYISLALPAFPASNIDLTQSFVDFSSDPSGSFAPASTDSFALSASTSALTTGNSEARFLVGSLTHCQLDSIRAVRFRIQATASCTFRCLAIRCLANSWLFAPQDTNTFYKFLGACVPPNGDINRGTDFPSSILVSGAIPTPYIAPTGTVPAVLDYWPVLIRSDGSTGPTLVDIEAGFVIQTGSNTGVNELTLLLRELPYFPYQMSKLEGNTMANIEAYGSQPDYAMGRIDDYFNTKYIAVKMIWGNTTGFTNQQTVTGLHLVDDLGQGYDFPVNFPSNSRLYLLASLTGSSLRARVYNIDNLGNIDWANIVADTTAVIDDNFVRRRKGRFGFFSRIRDGDSYIQHFRPRRVVYSEYRSAPFASPTPVDGVALFGSFTPPNPIFVADNILSFAGSSGGATVTQDTIKSASGRNFQVYCPGGSTPLQGLVTQSFYFDNLFDSEINLSLLTTSNTRVIALLKDSFRFIPLNVPQVKPNNWTTLQIPLNVAGRLVEPGKYSIYLIQNGTAANTFYVDNLSVTSRSVNWSARTDSDPANYYRVDWVDFGNTLNSPTSGIALPRGRKLQIRAQTLAPNAQVQDYKAVPRYSTLGNFVWTDQAPSIPTDTGSTFTSSVSGLTATFTATAAANTALRWNFGDGFIGYGSPVSHTYTTHDTYNVTLITSTTLAHRTTVTNSVTV